MKKKRFREYSKGGRYWWMATANSWRRGHTSSIREGFIRRPETLEAVLSYMNSVIHTLNTDDQRLLR